MLIPSKAVTPTHLTRKEVNKSVSRLTMWGQMVHDSLLRNLPTASQKSSPPRRITLSNHYEEDFTSRGFSPSFNWWKPFIKTTRWIFSHSTGLNQMLGKYSRTQVTYDTSRKTRSRFTLLPFRNLYQKKRKPWFSLADSKSNKCKQIYILSVYVYVYIYIYIYTHTHTHTHTHTRDSQLKTLKINTQLYYNI